MLLVGGQLLIDLAALGISPAAVTDMICTHLRWIEHPSSAIE